jgi:nicotinamide-nucleotide amidase
MLGWEIGRIMLKLLSDLSNRLKSKQIKLVTVESCTGGWIGKSVTDLAGSSTWYEAGFVTYTNEAKNLMVNVPMAHFEKFGAVSLEVAEAMATGASGIFPDCVTVSVTGCAGPGGGSAEKPVGTVCIASCYRDEVCSQRFLFDGDREQIRRASVVEALKMVLSMRSISS